MKTLSATLKLKLNTATSILLQITSVICGIILPRLILKQYGSSVNGLISSITQFLSLITFLELGLGAVIPSALYKPLAENNNDEISAIVTSGSKFFKRIAFILLGYVIILMAIYPLFVSREFDWLFTASLIGVISISSFAQYYYGIVDRLLLTADQRGYIQYSAQIITLILNTAACAILIRLGASIHMVKLTTSIIFLIRPYVLRIYVNNHYQINRNYPYKEEPIKQKWNGIAQHIAAVVLSDTDIIVLTVLSTLSNVSIYTVYNLVLTGVKNLFLSATNGVQSLMGELWAKQRLEDLRNFFGMLEFLIHTAVVFVFTCAGILIVPFVQVYTKGVVDADYYQPLFAGFLTMAHAGHCLRLPYNIMILAAGHYKQTQSNYIVAAILNIVISVLTVWKFGLIGVAFGTLVAMAYQTVWMAMYDSKNIINWPFTKFLKQIAFDIISAALIVLATSWINLKEKTYISWAAMGCKVAVIAMVVIFSLSFLFYRDQIKRFVILLRKR